MGIKTFWADNKKSYLISCTLAVMGVTLITLTQQASDLGILVSVVSVFPVMFILSFGMYKFLGGD